MHMNATPWEVWRMLSIFGWPLAASSILRGYRKETFRVVFRIKIDKASPIHYSKEVTLTLYYTHVWSIYLYRKRGLWWRNHRISSAHPWLVRSCFACLLVCTWLYGSFLRNLILPLRLANIRWRLRPKIHSNIGQRRKSESLNLRRCRTSILSTRTRTRSENKRAVLPSNSL